MSVVFLFFFFKQKTAYEMRISDLSSDVCSSDLTQLRVGSRERSPTLRNPLPRGERGIERGEEISPPELAGRHSLDADIDLEEAAGERLLLQRRLVEIDRRGGDVEAVELGSAEGAARDLRDRHLDDAVDLAVRRERSEEHTSELQSLMRISYAVFCLKKQKTYTKN